MLNEVLRDAKSRLFPGKKLFTIIILTIGLISIINAQGITNTLGGNTANDKFIVENSGSEAGLVVTGEGNVGIGTTTPNARLHLKGDNFPNSFMFMESNTDKDAGFRFIEDGTTMWHIFNSGGVNSQLNIRNNAYQPCITISQTDGNVSVGTASPTAKLHVSGDNGVLFTGTWNTGTIPVEGEGTRMMWYPAKAAFRAGYVNWTQWNDANIGDYSTAMGFYTTASGDWSTALGREIGASGDYSVAIALNDQNGIYISQNNTMAIMGGRVGINIKNPSHLLDVGNSGAYCDGGAWIDGSSRKYKENIAKLALQEAMETVMQLDPVKYNYKTNLTEDYIGFIAEDVPELVATNDRKGLSPMDIVAVLTKVTQEQQKLIENLSGRIEELEGK